METNGATAVPDNDSIPHSLFETIIQMSTLTRTTGISANFLGTALYLAHVNEQKTFILPSVSDLAKTFPGDKKRVSRHSILTRLDIPIYTAITLSPFLLLGDMNLCMSRPTMTDFTRAWFLGRITRTQALHRIETELWIVALKVALGMASLHSALQDFWRSDPVLTSKNLQHPNTRLIKPTYYNLKRQLEDDEVGEEDEDNRAVIATSSKRPRQDIQAMARDFIQRLEDNGEFSAATERLRAGDQQQISDEPAGSRNRAPTSNQSASESRLTSLEPTPTPPNNTQSPNASERAHSPSPLNSNRQCDALGRDASEPSRSPSPLDNNRQSDSPYCPPPPYRETVGTENGKAKQVRQQRVRKGKGKAKAAGMREELSTSSESNDEIEPANMKKLTYSRDDVQSIWPSLTIKNSKLPVSAIFTSK